MIDGIGAPKLVIFDCDGVLVDSEPISLAVTLEVLSEAGCHLSEVEGYEHLLGRSMASIVTWLRETHRVDLTEAHHATLRERLFARFRSELQPVPGIAKAVSALDCRVCVASSSQLDRIRLSLDLTGLRPLFEPHVFSASMVQRGKPAPDLFLHAARAMGIAPQSCVVVEDSPAGLEAARAAGMKSVAFVGGAHAGAANLAEKVAKLAPDAIIHDMTTLVQTVQNLS